MTMRGTVPSMIRRRLHWYIFLLMTTSLTLFMSSLFLRSANSTNDIDDAVALPTTTVVKANDDINGTHHHHHHHQPKPHHPDLQDALVTTGEITNSTSTNWTGERTKNSSSIQNNNISDVVLVEKDQNETKKPVHNISQVGDLLKEKQQTTSNLRSSNDTALDTTKALPHAQKNGSVPAKGDRTNSTLQTNPQQHKGSSGKNGISDGQPTARICWVGVDEDWEVRHSFDTIIKPLDDAGYKIKLGIFLQVGRKDHIFPPFREPYSFSNNAKYDGESLYVNTTFPFNERANWLYTKLRFQSRNRYEFPYGDAKNLTSMLLPYINNLTSSQYEDMVHVNHYIPLVNPPTPVDYLHTTSFRDGTIHRNGGVTATPEAISKVSEIMIAKKKPIPQEKAVSSSEQLISRKSFERTVWRVVNHVRDMHSNFLCGRWLKKMRQNSTKFNRHSNDQDDLIIRLGEDTRLWQPLNVSHIQKNLKPNQVLTIQAYTNRGHDNDQVEIYKEGSGGFSNRIHVAMMKAYPGIYQKGMFVANGVIKTLADYLRLIHESLGFEVLVWAERSISSTNDTPPKTTTTTWTKLPPLTTVLPFNLSSAKLPVQYPLSKHDYIRFENDTVMIQPADFAISNETSTTTASNGIAKAPPVSPIATANNNETITSNSKKKRPILVCITGQQERLEFENKVKTLLKPMSDEYEIDIVVVIQDGQAIFQRRKKQSKRQDTTFPTSDDVYNYLTTSVHLTFANVSVRTYEPPLAFPINPQFLIQKGLGLGFQQKKNQFMKARKLEMVTERIAANLKMMQAYQMCYSKYDKVYDLYLRIREDVGFRNKVPLENYSPILNHTEAFLVPKRLGNGGINDRLAFVTGHQSALCYFHLPFVQMFSGWMLDHAMANTESYFKRLYWMHECPKVRAFPTKKNKLDPIKMFQGRFIEH